LRFSTPESGDKQTPEDDKVLSTPFISSTPDSDNNQAQEDGKVLSTELEFSSKYIDSKLSGETESLNGENKVENESENVSVSYEHKETVTLGNEETEIGSVEDEQRVRNSVPVQAALDSSANKRVSPRNPRLELAGAGFEDIVKSFSGEYKTKDDEITEEEPRKERRQLYTPEEKILLNQRTPDLQRATSDGLTALHKAVLCKKEGIVNYLLKAGGSALIRDKDGATLIHYAVEVAAIQTIKLLILYKVDINLPDNHGWTPLHLAVQSKRTDVVRLLLVKGADKSIRNKDGIHLWIFVCTLGEILEHMN